jgi:60 kDa SS-A/Ro ribonucleoprotein
MSKGDRPIVFTNEQSRDRVPAPKRRGYMAKVASHQHGVGHSARV